MIRLALAPGDLESRPVSLAEMGEWIGPALIAAEDRRFHSHPGVDPLAVLRALGQNAGSGRVVSGASTLTTQVIRMARPRPRNLLTKSIEAAEAFRLEAHTGKEDILQTYLNLAPFGGNLAGVEAASQAWFGKSAAALSLPEAALLAGLPQSPSRLRPDRNPEGARERREYVLGRMAALEYITPAQHSAASAHPLPGVRTPPPFRAPHFADWLLARRAPAPVWATTLDPRIQALAERELHRAAEALAPRGVTGGAVVVVENRTRAIRAMVGSPDYDGEAGQVNGAAVRRSPGSALKPLVFVEALDRGRISPLHVLADVPLVFADYRPTNFDPGYRGPVSARDALILSLNIPALTLTRDLGPERLLTKFRAAGLVSLDAGIGQYGVALALGAGEVTLLELVETFATLATGGVHHPLRALESDPLGSGVRLWSEEACWLVADMLGGPERSLALHGHVADAVLPRFAWKTGTSSGTRDAWTVAWSPDYTVGVWIGNPDGRSSPALVGIEAAAPVAGRIFRGLVPSGEGPWYPPPPGLIRRDVCGISGHPVGSACPSVVADMVIRGVSPTEPCPVHQRHPDGTVREVWPEALARWMAAPRSENGFPGAPPSLSIRSPVGGQVYRAVANPARAGALLLRAEGGSGGHHWFANGQSLGPTPAGRPLAWNPTPGSWELVCADADGATDRIRIRVE